MNKMIPLLLAVLVSFPLSAQKISKEKKQVIDHVNSHEAQLISLSDEIWGFEETAFEEYKSSAALADYAEAQGFRVTRGVAGMPTAFIAEYGSGAPVIGIMGEFDALPGLSQKTVPTKEPRNAGAPGHGCGHNIFGTASLGAASAIKALIDDGSIKGTVRFYGTPAEEKFFGKLWMIREGLFDDVDVCMDWHPSYLTEASVQSSQALVDYYVEYFGQAAHAAADPWNGRSAGDAAELFTTGINMYREHVKPTVRMHYHIMEAAQVVNVVPDYAKVWMRVRDSKTGGMREVWKQTEEIARGAAIMANVDYKITLISGVHEILVNRTGGAALHENLEYLGDITYTEEEVAFARRIQQATGKPEEGLDASIKPLRETMKDPEGGSTDVGDVSQVVPVISLSATIAPKGTPWHSWAVVACGGMSIGHKGLVYASKALAMTMVDLYKDESLRRKIKEEFKERLGEYKYEGILPPGPPPIPENTTNE